VTNAADRFGAIRFDEHATAAAVARLPAAKVVRERVEIDGEAGGKPLEDRDERFAVRLASGQKSQHSRFILAELFARFFQRPRDLPNDL